jgi:sugar/nucleoside kinase (ribokinase family)
MLDVVTFGEALALFTPTTAEPLRFARQFELRWGGTECNFALALTRLGLRAGWQSLLGDDEMGRLILQGARGEGIDVSRVQVVTGRRTGLYLKQFVAGRTEVFYYREGSADGALIATPGGRLHAPGLVVERIVDPVGAGDGFDAGFVAGQLMGWDLADSAQLGNVVGASALGVPGDFEAYPTLAEAQAWLQTRPNVAR